MGCTGKIVKMGWFGFFGVLGVIHAVTAKSTAGHVLGGVTAAIGLPLTALSAKNYVKDGCAKSKPKKSK